MKFCYSNLHGLVLIQSPCSKPKCKPFTLPREEKRVRKEKTGKETHFLCLVTVFSQKQSPQLLIGTP